jgi:hypothetical protein
MAEKLFTSEVRVKSTTSLNDNIAGKYVLTSILEAQRRKLKPVLGEILYNKIKDLLVAGTLDSESGGVYKTLLDECQDFLAYSAAAIAYMKVSYKVGNFGVAKSQDENLQVATPEEIITRRREAQTNADDCCHELQQFLLRNKADYPELTESECHRIKSNLYSAATCGIWLGGLRGRILR